MKAQQNPALRAIFLAVAVLAPLVSADAEVISVQDSDRTLPKVRQTDADERPGFASCAAYYFLAARGHGMQDYERLYGAGEFALNEAARRHGRAAAEARMGEVSGAMMELIERDWRNIGRLDARYAGRCEVLLEDARHHAAGAS